MDDAVLPEDLAAVCGQLIVGGFEGKALPQSFARSLRERRAGGAILFKRNIAGLAEVARLNEEIANAAPEGLPPLVGIDQEGGRVARLGPPALRVPPMRSLAARDPAFAARVARAQSRELAVLGFTMNFAPVLDVNTNPQNPVIGDRAFGDDAALVATFGAAYLRGMREGGMLSCGKHFPGHGDTSLDSHLALPYVDHARARLDQVELVPFRAAIDAGVDAIMTAHVVCRALDPHVPATLSRAICTQLLREELGFRGVLISDDLEMKAISAGYGVDDAATGAIAAGCDLLLVCSDESLQARAHAALVARAEKDDAFRARCREACARVLAMRRRVPPRPRVDEIDHVLADSREVSEALA